MAKHPNTNAATAESHTRASWWVRNSKYGLGLLAIRDDEDRARGLGVSTGPFKLIAFIISAFFVGMIGAVWAYFLESIFPSFAFDPLFDVLVADVRRCSSS